MVSIAALGRDDVERFLRDRYHPVHEVEALAGGQWSRAFKFASEGRRLVVRFGHHAEDHAKDRSAARAWGAALPVPEVLHLGDAFDGVHAVSVHAPGEAIDQLGADDLRATLPALIDTLRTMRELEVPGSGFGPWDARTGDAPFSTWAAYLRDVPDRSEDRLMGWRAALDARPRDAEVFATGCEALAVMAERWCPDERGLIHNDLLAGNVLAQDGRITAVLDWGNSLAGDPLYDVAWLLYWAPWHPGLEPSAIHVLADDLLTGDHVEERLRTYQLHIALDHQQYCAWRGYADDLRWNTAQVERLVEA